MKEEPSRLLFVPLASSFGIEACASSGSLYCMRIVKAVRAMQTLSRQAHEARLQIAFVPTMGCLHAGHLSLVQRARRVIGPKGLVVVSIYVNPAQFGPNEDYAKYPRTLPRDRRLCREAGVDILFAPADREMYPVAAQQRFSTYVVEEALSPGMEGASRPTHFRGVTTIVAKLLNIVDADVAVFGAKDYQQAAVVKRMVRDLNFRTRIIVGPTKRARDGLAMSSRNQYLSDRERLQAPVLWQAIRLARQMLRGPNRSWPADQLRQKLSKFIGQQPAARVDYIAFFHPVGLEPVETVRRGTHLALAVFIGETRLIDNGRL